MLQIVEALTWLVMAIAMMKQTTWSVALIVEIVATLAQVKLIALIAHASLEIFGKIRVIH